MKTWLLRGAILLHRAPVSSTVWGQNASSGGRLPDPVVTVRVPGTAEVGSPAARSPDSDGSDPGTSLALSTSATAAPVEVSMTCPTHLRASHIATLVAKGLLMPEFSQRHSTINIHDA